MFLMSRVWFEIQVSQKGEESEGLGAAAVGEDGRSGGAGAGFEGGV